MEAGNGSTIHGYIRRRRKFSKLLNFFTLELLDDGEGRDDTQCQAVQLVCDGWTAPRTIVPGVYVSVSGQWEEAKFEGSHKRFLVRNDGFCIERNEYVNDNPWSAATMHAEWRKRSGATCFCTDPLCPKSHGDSRRWAERQELVAQLRSGKKEGDNHDSESCAAKAQHNYIFVSWIIQTFPDSVLRQGVVDIAGGRGLIGLELLLQHNKDAVALVEPKELRLNSTYRRRLKKWQKKQHLQVVSRPFSAAAAPMSPGENDQDTICAGTAGAGVDRDDAQSHHRGTHAEDKYDDDETTTKVPVPVHHPLVHFREEFHGLEKASASLRSVLRSAGLVVAMHADAATGAALETAIALDKPFAIVPCCVFTHMFPDRKTATGEVVSTYDQLLDYLQALGGDSVMRTELPFQGRNVVLYRL